MVWDNTDVGDTRLQNHQHDLSRTLAGTHNIGELFSYWVNVFKYESGRPTGAKKAMQKVTIFMQQPGVGGKSWSSTDCPKDSYGEESKWVTKVN